METLAAPLTPDDIDLGFVAELVPDLAMATIGDEQVVIGGATQLVVLNPTAALIFRFLDGEASLGELVDDFTEVLGVDQKVVEDDVLAFVRELGQTGCSRAWRSRRPRCPRCPSGTTTGPHPRSSHPATSSTTSPCPISRATSGRSPTRGGSACCSSTGARAAGSAWRSRPSSRRWHHCSKSSGSISCSWRSATPTPTARSSTTPGWRRRSCCGVTRKSTRSPAPVPRPPISSTRTADWSRPWSSGRIRCRSWRATSPASIPEFPTA